MFDSVGLPAPTTPPETGALPPPRAVATPVDAARHVPFLDGWRGLAITALLLGHFFDDFGTETRVGINCGRLGVELFFVLSGVLMGRLLFVKRVPLALFYKRRISRIVPVLIIYVLAITAYLLARHAHPGRAVLSTAFLVFNYVGHAPGVPHQFDHLWSICIEEHGYLVLGLVAVVAPRLRIAPQRAIAILVMLVWLFAAGYTAFTHWDYYDLFWRSEARLGGIFGSAGLAAWLARRERPLISGRAAVAAFALGIVLQSAVVPDLLKYTLGTLCLSLAVVHLEWAPRWFLKPFEHPWLVRLGVLSYSIYLWQQPFYAFGAHHPRLRFATLPAALITGALSFKFLEKPTRAWLNARWN
jgi:peptidoglycan/LPS O-acetylase OafA/YrhL